MAKSTVGVLNVIIGANSQQFLAAMSATRAHIGSIASTLKTAVAGTIGFAGLSAIQGFASDSMRLSMELEKIGASFRTIAKDDALAGKSIEELRAFADISPFGMEETFQAARKLIGTGTPIKALIPNLRILGEVAAGSGGDIGLMAKALSDIGAKGHLAAQETNQFSDQGVNLLGALATMYGKTRDEVLAMREAHQITARDVRKALLQMATGSGTYAGGMNRFAQTNAGQLEQVRAQWARAKTQLGDAITPIMIRLAAMGTVVARALSSIKKETIESTLKFGAWVAATAAFLWTGRQIVRVAMLVVSAYRAMSIASTISQALQGPKGWAVIAAGLLAASSAAYAVNKAFENVNAEVSTFAEMTQEEIDAFLGPMADQSKAVNEELEKAASKLDQMRDKGRQVAESLRTPMEIFADEIREAKTLLDAAVISGETYARWVAKAREDFQESQKAAEKIRDAQEGVGAAVRGTTAGFSAVAESRRNLEALKRQEELEKQQLAALKRQEAQLRAIEQNTKVEPIDARIVRM